MNLQQLHRLKHWHVTHQHGRTIEFTLCDMVLGAWIGGWAMLLPLLALQELAWLPLSLLLIMVPEGYCSLRRRLHLRGTLRCDWLDALQPSRQQGQ